MTHFKKDEQPAAPKPKKPAALAGGVGAAEAPPPVATVQSKSEMLIFVVQRERLAADEAKAELVKLQQGDVENRAIWQRIIDLSRQEFDGVYRRLGVSFDHTLGESFYNPMLPGVVADLRQRGIAIESSRHGGCSA